MPEPTFKAPTGPSALLQDLAALGVPRLSADGNFLLRPDGTIFGVVSPALPDVTIDPDGGEVAADDPIALACADADADIYYTTDGTEPDEGSTLYAGTFTLAEAATVKARAFRAGYVPSAIASADFTIAP
jgi:hypothetical protein